jgi:catechol-2,3-dioxygenase
LSPVVALSTTDLDRLESRLKRDGVSYTGPQDHGWALVISFRDPEGNRIEILKLT